MNSIRRATASDVPAIAELWNVALRDEEMAQWPLDCGNRAVAVEAEFGELARGYVDLDAVWVDADLQAAAAWLPPGSQDAFESVDERVHQLVVPLMNDNGARYEAFWTWVFESMPTEPMWFLDILAVRADARGTGIGSALLQHGLALAKSDGVPAILETSTPRNVSYYERFGFEVIFSGQSPVGGPTVWFMTAKP